MSLLISNARVLTLGVAAAARRGAALGDLGVLPRADVRVSGGRIEMVSTAALSRGADEQGLDAAGRVLMPGFVDCHTHTCFAGDRLDEWQMKLKGAAYLDILKSGGGIMSTVRAVRSASEKELARLVVERLRDFVRGGTTTLEIKSGYGLSTRDELKMLRAIKTAAGEIGSTGPGVVLTAMLGHAMDADVSDFVDRTINDTLPAVHAEFPGIAIDAFCETGAWSLADTVRLFEKARSLGHPLRVHADQFTSMGMVAQAVRLHAVSVDHLEATSEADAKTLAASETFAVGLPCTGLHLSKPGGGDYANLRRLVDLGAKVAIATNFNPGSSPTTSMPLAIAAAVRYCGLSPQEAIAACTVNAAALLGFTDRGFIAPGARADMVLLRHTDERTLAYEMGGNPTDHVIHDGRVMA
jgi:imidazolonepropionase